MGLRWLLKGFNFGVLDDRKGGWTVFKGDEPKQWVLGMEAGDEQDKVRGLVLVSA